MNTQLLPGSWVNQRLLFLYLGSGPMDKMNLWLNYQVIKWNVIAAYAVKVMD